MEGEEERLKALMEKMEANAELYLQYFLAIRADPDERQRIVQRVSQQSGVSADKVDQIVDIMIPILLRIARSN
jgi:hypothetical protein